jgi:regulatory protein
MAMPPPRSPRSASRPAPRPLDRGAIGELALAYVGRFATSEARLARYLNRKLFERGWNDEGTAADAIAAAVARCAELGFVNDKEFAHMRGQSLARRGLGARRVQAQLAVDGIGGDAAAPVIADASDRRLATALAFARRRRLGPFGSGLPTDPKALNRAIGAFLRAGHDPATARRILTIAPDDADALAELDAAGEAG